MDEISQYSDEELKQVLYAREENRERDLQRKALRPDSGTIEQLLLDVAEFDAGEGGAMVLERHHVTPVFERGLSVEDGVSKVKRVYDNGGLPMLMLDGATFKFINGRLRAVGE